MLKKFWIDHFIIFKEAFRAP